MTRSKILAALLVGAGITAVAAQSGTAWPPALQSVSDESPALVSGSGDEDVRPAARLSRRAGRQRADGRRSGPDRLGCRRAGMWVIEMLGYMAGHPATNEREPIGRVSVLEDTNNDGRMDKKTVFLDGLVLPRALKVLDKGVLVAEPPHLWLARDTNGDLKADSKELVCDCYGTALANVEHNANGLLWALDNWMHTSEGDTYFRLKDGKFETRKTLRAGSGARRRMTSATSIATRTARRCTSTSSRRPTTPGTRTCCAPAAATSSWATRTSSTRRFRCGRIAASIAATQTGSFAPTARWRPTPASARRRCTAAIGCRPSCAAMSSSPSRPAISSAASSSATMARSLRGRKAYDNAEFLASTDERFRPVYLSSAPDGTLYVVDMYHGIIQHKGFITEYLRDHIVAHKLEAPVHMGRIFRIVHDTTRRDGPPALSTESPAQLVATLAHPNGWWRDTAQQLLVQRGDKPSVAGAEELAESGAGRADASACAVDARWARQRSSPRRSIKALDDSSRDVRASRGPAGGAISGGAPIRRCTPPCSSASTTRTGRFGSSWRRRWARCPGARETALTSLLEQHAGDPVAVDAALSGLRGGEVPCSRTCCSARRQTPQRGNRDHDARGDDCARRAGRGRRRSSFSVWPKTTRPEWQRAALLRGAEVALLGAAMPGTPAGRGGRGGAAARAAAMFQRRRRANAAVRAAHPRFPRAGGARPAAPRAPRRWCRWRSRRARRSRRGGGGGASEAEP